MVDIANIPPELMNILRNQNSEPKLVGAADGDQQLEPGDGIVRVVPPATSTTTITLPGVAAAKGMEFFIMSDGNASGTITVEEKGDGIIAFSDVVLTVDLDRVLVKNIAGLYWVPEFEVST